MKNIKEKITNIKRKNETVKIKGKVLYATASMLLINSIPVLAAPNKYARNASDWILDGVRVIALAAAAGIMGTFLLKRKFVQMLVTLVVSGIVLSIIYNPETLKSIGDYLTSIFFG